MSNYLNAYKCFLFILTVALLNVFSPSEILCLYIHFTGYQMKASHIDLIYILMNDN